jgi:hypothetical protein
LVKPSFLNKGLNYKLLIRKTSSGKENTGMGVGGVEIFNPVLTTHILYLAWANSRLRPDQAFLLFLSGPSSD